MKKANPEGWLSCLQNHSQHLLQVDGGLANQLAALFIDVDEIGARHHLVVVGLDVVGPHRCFLAVIVDSHKLGELQGLAIGLEGILVALSFADDGTSGVGDAHIEQFRARLDEVVGCHGEINPDALGTVGTVGASLFPPSLEAHGLG